MNNKTLEDIVSNLMNKLYALSYAIVANDIEAEQLIVDAYTRFILDDKEFILETKIDDSADKSFFSDFAFKRIVQEIYSLAQKRSRSFMYAKQMNPDEFNVFYTLSLESRIVMFLNTALNLNEEQIAKTLLIPRHEVVALMFQAKGELLEISANG